MVIAVPGGAASPVPPPDISPVEVDLSTSEKDLTALGDKLAKQRGYDIHPTTDALNPRSGFPQRLYFKNGRMVVVEYLPQDRELSDTQTAWAEEFEMLVQSSSGAVVMSLIKPSGWQQLRESLVWLNGQKTYSVGLMMVSATSTDSLLSNEM